MACAVLAATGQLPAAAVAEAAVFGELSEDGTIRLVRGILPLAGAAARAGIRTVIVPAGNAAEAALAGDLDIVAVDSLHQLVEHLRGGPPPPAPAPPRRPHSRPVFTEDTPAAPAWWPLQVAAAGGHHLAIHGHHLAATPLVQALVGLLPDLDRHAAWEVTCLASLAGPPHTPTTLSRRPPHQILGPGATAAELEGHGRGLTHPGLLSMAHHGVLYLPAAAQIAVEQLGQVRSAHGHHQVVPPGGQAPVRLPARFQLVLAAAACPCPPGGGSCGCTPADRRRHQAPIRRLLDRAHIHLQPPPQRRPAGAVGTPGPDPAGRRVHRAAAVGPRPAWSAPSTSTPLRTTRCGWCSTARSNPARARLGVPPGVSTFGWEITITATTPTPAQQVALHAALHAEDPVAAVHAAHTVPRALGAAEAAGGTLGVAAPSRLTTPQAGQAPTSHPTTNPIR